jgi:hypothetical protein
MPRVPFALLLALAAALLAPASPGAAQAAVPSTCEDIQAWIDGLRSGGGELLLPPGTFVCNAPIVIDRDDVTLRGHGPATRLRLADGANAPVLVIGGTSAVPPAVRRRIVVADLVIDGNRLAQDYECQGGPCGPEHWLRNNGISLRRVEDVRVERVGVHSARSGGLVSELVCRRLTLRDVTSFDNHFDGVAAYETEDSLFSGLYLHDNLAAGFSFDIAFNGNLVSDVVIAASGSVGVFMRDSRDNLFSNLRVRDSAEHGLFLAQVDGDPSKPAAGNTFEGVLVSGSGGAGVRVNDASCVDNVLGGAQLVGNAGGGVSEAVPGLLHQHAVMVR